MMNPLRIIQGDLLKQDVEAIVNAANTSLEGGGGIDGMIHRAAGSALLEACKAYKEVHHLSRIHVGDAVITSSFEIERQTPSIKYVIHTVGPNCRTTSQNEKRKELLERAYLNSLEKASEEGIKSIAFPAISTGIYGYPFEEAQEVALRAVQKYLDEHPNAFTEVRFVYYSQEDFKRAKRIFKLTEKK